jgi:hypothetical protein
MGINTSTSLLLSFIDQAFKAHLHDLLRAPWHLIGL